MKVKRLDHKIDKAIADYNNSFVTSTVNQHGGSLDKQSFWKVKRVLGRKSITVPHSVIYLNIFCYIFCYDGFGNEITDEANIRSEHKNDFKHRLRTREIDGQLKEVETMQNHLCQFRLLKSRTEVSPDLSIEDFDKAIGELKSGKSTDPTGLIREVFKNGGQCLKQLVHMMMNAIKRTYIFPLQWSQIFIHIL